VRDKDITIFGVVLNVPLVCDYRHLPADCTGSYDECTNALLSSGDMRAVWDLIIPSAYRVGSNPKASPLLGDVAHLVKHLVFVAGQDPLRNEGLAYAKKLQTAGVPVKMHAFPGVPHRFAEFWELNATKRFWRDITGGSREWLA
jgi:acetyl esterase/lipase